MSATAISTRRHPHLHSGLRHQINYHAETRTTQET